MKEYFKNRVFLFLALIVFIALKWQHLHYAFYWDESYVYVPAIRTMYEHGLSLLPGAVPVQYATGHPLMYYAAGAAWMKLFGTSNFGLHCFALFVSCILAVVLYEVVLKLFSKRVAVIGAVLLLSSFHFFAWSCIVLSDVMLALLALLSLYCYVMEKRFLTMLLLTILFLTKESGWVFAVLIACDTLLLAVTRKKTAKEILLNCISVIVPLLFVLLFFILQKKTFGWYLYPVHTSSFDRGIANTLYNLKRSLLFLFYSNGIYCIYILFAAMIVYNAILQRKASNLLTLLFLVSVYPFILIFSSVDAVFYVFAAVCIIRAALFFFQPLPGFSDLQVRFIKLATAFGLLFMYFCCVNFYEPRYVFPSLVILLFLLALYFDKLIAQTSMKVYVPLVSAIALVGLINIFVYGHDIDAYTCMDVQQHIVDYCENNDLYEKRIGCSFLQFAHLTDPYTGFLRGKRKFDYAHANADNDPEYIICDNIDSEGHILDARTSTSYKLIYRYQEKGMWAEVYRKI